MRWRTLLVFVLFCLVPGEFLHAQQDERAVRAAFVFNLTKYVSWPQRHDGLVIGVLGQGSMGPILKQQLDGKSSDGKKITVILHPSETELRECNIVYITQSAPMEVSSTLHRLSRRAVLTVGEGDGFARAGGMVGLVRSGDQMQIEVNLRALQAEQLQMSSRLLRLAVIFSGSGGSR